jgi:penicillin-binding protein A
MGRWLVFAIGVFTVVALLTAGRTWRPCLARQSPSPVETPALAIPARAARDGGPERPPSPAVESTRPVTGLQLSRISPADGSLTAPAEGGTARLTLNVDLQRSAVSMMASRHLPEAAVVLMDVATGRLLVYASHVEAGTTRDLCAEALAPSASVFKIVTAAALIEEAHLGPETRQCYAGGEQHIEPVDLIEDPKRDRWCVTLAGALGRSVNAVFARLAQQYLGPQTLDRMARKFGYGEPLPFDAPVQPSEVNVPSDSLEFARTAAGFWNTTLSPLEAAEISAIVARGGERVRPSVVAKVVGSSGAVVWEERDESDPGRAIARETADKLASMMERTVSDGTSFRAFHDPHGVPFLPGIAVAGKTGTLKDGRVRRYFTWFTGFAPVRPMERVPQVAVAVLVVNGPRWQVKANGIARDVLRFYFAAHEVPSVSRPTITTIPAQRRTAKAPTSHARGQDRFPLNEQVRQ